VIAGYLVYRISQVSASHVENQKKQTLYLSAKEARQGSATTRILVLYYQTNVQTQATNPS